MKVIRRDSSSSAEPTVGVVLGYEDDERVLVVWGDAAFNPTEHADEARTEQLHELIPVR